MSAAEAPAASPSLAVPPRLQGYPGFWVFILAELIFFGVLFISYVYERSGQAELFARSQRALDVGLGLTNTLILLTSSWFVALAVHEARDNAPRRVCGFLTLSILCGMAFTGIKIVEYGAKLGAGITMLTNDFFTFYYFLTSLHLLHLIAGTIVLTLVAVRARRGAYHSGDVEGIETAAVYWHMVDLFWVMLFPLLYLARA